MPHALGRRVIVCSLVILAGCHAMPDRPPPEVAPKLVGPTIQLFGEVEEKQAALERTLLQYIPPGTPGERAQALLREQGFDCISGEGPKRFTHPDGKPHGVCLPQKAWQRSVAGTIDRKVVCNATRYAGSDEWHLLAYHIHILLILDEARAVETADVGIRAEQHPESRFFEKHPEFRSPAGLVLEEAKARMLSFGFLCHEDARSRISCERLEENALGGNIIRVSLVPDESRVVREVVVDGPDWFDAERCMLPRDGDSTAWAVSKIPLYPVRLACRYALHALAIILAGAATGAATGAR